MNAIDDEALHDLLDRAIPDLPPRLIPPAAATIRRHSRRRRARLTAVVAGVTVLAVAGVALPTLRDRADVPVGGGVTVLTLRATTTDGEPPSAGDLNHTATLLSQRLAAFGLRKTTARVQDASHIVITAASAKSRDVLVRLSAPGQFQIRLVLAQTTNDQGDPGTASATVDPTPPSLPMPPAPATMPGPTLPEVRAKLGAAYDLAAQSIESGSVMADAPGLQPFAALTAAEVAVLPVSMRYGVPRIGCDKLAAGGATPAGELAVACDFGTKFLLDATAVDDADVSRAVTRTSPDNDRPEVVVSFVDGGQEEFTNLTRVAYGDGTDPRQVAVMLDGTILTVPTVVAVIPGDAEVQPAYSTTDTRIVAALLNDGPLPIHLTAVEPN